MIDNLEIIIKDSNDSSINNLIIYAAAKEHFGNKVTYSPQEAKSPQEPAEVPQETRC